MYLTWCITLFKQGELYMDLKWLNTPALESDGVSWGVPWKKGELLKIEDIQLQNEQQSNLPLQSWPTAYWPDGSIKWSGHAAIYDGKSSEFTLSKGDSSVLNA